MPAATVTSKGRITIPKKVRDALDVGEGDRVSFLVRNDGVVEMRAAPVDLIELVGMLKPKRQGVVVEAMNAAIRKAPSRR